jgi:predicted dehydrogenase
MATYGVGVYGVGAAGREYIKALDGNPLTRVVAVVDQDARETARRISEMNVDAEVMESFDRMLERADVQIVVITTPHPLHAAAAIAAARRGKHVMVEKPIGMSLGEIQEVRDAITAAGVKSQCGMVLRWDPFITNIKRLIDRQILGRVFYIEVDYFHELGSWWSGFSWGVNKRSGGPSASFVGGIHAIDLMRWFGGDVEEVASYGTHGHRADFEYDPTYVAAVKFSSGAIGKTGCSYEVKSPYLINVVVHGSKGSVINDRFFIKDLFPGQTGWQKFETIVPGTGDVTHHRFRELVNDFLDAVANDREPCVGMEEMYKTHEVCEAITRSIEARRPMALPLGTEGRSAKRQRA